VNEDRSATLILRVWVEGGTGDLRGRLTSLDTSAGQEADEVTVTVASSPGALVDAVGAWLEEFVRATSPPGGRSS
jgi:hypothetical protein